MPVPSPALDEELLPGWIKIVSIRAFDLPDADTDAKSNISDPYVTFSIKTKAGRITVRTPTAPNSRNPVWEAGVSLEIPAEQFSLTGMEMDVCVWDDDSKDDGINSDDAMGRMTFSVDPSGGQLDRATIDGIGALYAFRVSFKYEVIPPPGARRRAPVVHKELPTLPKPNEKNLKRAIELLRLVARDSYTAISEHEMFRRTLGRAEGWSRGSPDEQEGYLRPEEPEKSRVASANMDVLNNAIYKCSSVAAASDKLLVSLLVKHILEKALTKR